MIRAMKLFYQKHSAHSEQLGNLPPTVQTPVILLPGLFGSTRNWRSFAAELSKVADVYVVDQRNHGESPHADSQSYADMVADLCELLDTLNAPNAHLIGHSMGGKVAMACALWHPERVSSLSVLDIAPIAYSHSHAPFLQAMLKIDVRSLRSRTEAERLLTDAIPDKATRLFLLQSLVGSPGAYEWQLNLQVLYDFMADIVGFPIESTTLQAKASIPTLFVRGELSDYVSDAGHAAIKQFFSNYELASIAEAGHWLHVEQPRAVLSEVTAFLLKNA